MRNDDLLKTVLEALKTQRLEVDFGGKPPKTRNGPGKDGKVRIGKGKIRLDYVAAIQPNLTPATVGALAVQLRQLEKAAGRPALLVTEQVTPPLAERLKGLDLQFIDAAGNAWLDGPGLLVWVVGRKPRVQPGRNREGRAFTTAGLKTLFALLCDPALAEGALRRIAEAAGVALGALPDILADLGQRGHLAIAGRNRRLVGTKRLLDEWAMVYARRLRPKTLTRTLVAARIDDWERWNLGQDGARWGGEPAARLLTRHLHPGILTIYATKIPARLIVERRLRAPAPGANEGLVEIRAPFWGTTLRTETPRRDVVPHILVYADLLAVGDARCLEAAQLVHERFLARLFPAH